MIHTKRHAPLVVPPQQQWKLEFGAFIFENVCWIYEWHETQDMLYSSIDQIFLNISSHLFCSLFSNGCPSVRGKF